MKYIVTLLCGLILAFAPLFSGINSVSAQEETVAAEESVVIVFGRDECGFCKALFSWLEEENIPFQYLNITKDESAKDLYNQVTAKDSISKVTPVTVIGERVLVGFNGPETTGKTIKKAIEAASENDIRTIQNHLEKAPEQDVIVGGACTDLSCELGEYSGFMFDLPFL